MISPLAFVDPSAKLGNNVTVMPFAYIDKNVVIGDDCVIMPYASVMDGTVMGKGNKVHQNAVLGAEPQDFKYCGDSTKLIIGDNNTFRENVVVSRATCAGNATTIGNGNFFMDRVHICHDVKVADECVLGIGVSVAGNSELEDCVILSSSVVVNQGCHIGKLSLLQSGCRLSKNVPPYVIVSGNPPAYHGINTIVMQHKLNVTDRILRHIVNAYRLFAQTGQSMQDVRQKIEDQIPMSDEIRDILKFIELYGNETVR